MSFLHMLNNQGEMLWLSNIAKWGEAIINSWNQKKNCDNALSFCLQACFSSTFPMCRLNHHWMAAQWRFAGLNYKPSQNQEAGLRPPHQPGWNLEVRFTALPSSFHPSIHHHSSNKYSLPLKRTLINGSVELTILSPKPYLKIIEGDETEKKQIQGHCSCTAGVDGEVQK